MSSGAVVQDRLCVALGPERSDWLDVGLPILAGEPLEELFGGLLPVGRFGAFDLFRVDEWTLGAASASILPGLEVVTHGLYLEMLHATAGMHLARIWNYIPAINEPDASGLENYRVFCRGRSMAFERRFGAGFKNYLPSASAVGSKSHNLSIVFAACKSLPRHIENPLQIPAYDYPLDYGPRAPSFSRATIVPHPVQPTVFISGTAAIRGHATMAQDCTPDQLDCVLENLREISLACGLGANLAAGPATVRHFKIYVRNPSEQPLVAATLQDRLLQSDDVVSYLHADICRASLSVEIEVTLCRRMEARADV